MNFTGKFLNALYFLFFFKEGGGGIKWSKWNDGFWKIEHVAISLFNTCGQNTKNMTSCV